MQVIDNFSEKYNLKKRMNQYCDTKVSPHQYTLYTTIIRIARFSIIYFDRQLIGQFLVGTTTAKLENVSKKVFFYVVYISGFIHHDKFLYFIGMWVSIIIVKSNLVIPGKT